MENRYDIRKHLTSQIIELLISTSEKLYETNMNLTKEILELQECLEKERSKKDFKYDNSNDKLSQVKECLLALDRPNTTVDQIIDKSLAIINKE
jgi:hypothetical protein